MAGRERRGPRLDFGRAFETLRASKGMSREETALLAGVSSSYLSEIERGLKRPSADIVAKIARAFGMRSSALLEYVEDLSAPLPVETSAPEPVQLRLRRGRPLPLFGDADAPQAASARQAGRARRPPAPGDAALSELLVIGRRLRADDLAALLQLARHLLARRG